MVLGVQELPSVGRLASCRLLCSYVLIERMKNEEFVKKVYQSSVEGPNRRGRPLGRWEDKVKEYVSERGMRGNGLEWARREYMDREKWRSICRSHPPWVCFRRE